MKTESGQQHFSVGSATILGLRPQTAFALAQICVRSYLDSRARTSIAQCRKLNVQIGWHLKLAIVLCGHS